MKQKLEKFGDLPLEDHIALKMGEELSTDDDRCGLTLWDQGTGWRDCFGVESKEATDAELALKEGTGTEELAKLYLDTGKN